MPRVKRGTQHVKRRKNLLERTKGMMWGRKSKIRLARTAVLKAGAHALRDRRAKKRTFRRLWTVKINAAIRPSGVSYSKFIDALKKGGIELDRKVLAILAEKHPAVFQQIINKVK